MEDPWGTWLGAGDVGVSWTQALSPLAPPGGCHPHPEVPPQLQEVHARRPEPGVRLHLEQGGVHTGKSFLDETKWRAGFTHDKWWNLRLEEYVWAAF